MFETAWSLSCRLASLAKTLVYKRRLARCGLGRATRIPSHTTQAELQQLYRLASECPPRSNALEIGSYLGASTCFIVAAMAVREGTLFCVDTWQNETMPEGERDTLAEFERNIAPVRDRVVMRRKRSGDLGPGDLPQAVWFGFIDGDHSYEAVRRDAEIVGPLISEGGVLAFHDAAYFVGVSRVVGELLQSGVWKLGGQVHNLVWLRREGFSE